MKTLPNFKIRASGAGQLMVNPRSKSETLSETTKTYAKNWLKEHIYGTRKEVKSKYMSKGIELEDEAIDKAIEWLDLPFTIKNEDFFEDDYFCGTPDLIVDGMVYDIKNSWDCFTFPLFEDEIPTKDYLYQLQVYMHLTGCKRAGLVYVLLNTPEHLTWEQPNNYDNVDKAYRIKLYEVEYNHEIIEELKTKVELVREYLNTINK